MYKAQCLECWYRHLADVVGGFCLECWYRHSADVVGGFSLCCLHVWGAGPKSEICFRFVKLAAIELATSTARPGKNQSQQKKPAERTRKTKKTKRARKQTRRKTKRRDQLLIQMMVRKSPSTLAHFLCLLSMGQLAQPDVAERLVSTCQCTICIEIWWCCCIRCTSFTLILLSTVYRPTAIASPLVPQVMSRL